MLKAKDFRRYAREALKGRWIKAGGVGLLAGLLGAAISTGTSSGSFGSGTETGSNLSSEINSIIGSSEISSVTASPEIPAMFFAVIMGIALVVLLWAIVVLVIGGATTLGYAKYNLNLLDDNEPRVDDIFSQYNRIGTGFGMQFFRGLFVFLWSLLFVIPGIIASYSYYMTPFILCENPDMTAREAIRESKELMKGNKLRLFCLELSFIGWELLAAAILWVVIMLVMTPMIFAGGALDEIVVPVLIILLVAVIIFAVAIGLTLSPYITASIAVFYREISEGRYSNPHVEGEYEDNTYSEYYEEPPVQEVVEEPYIIGSQDRTEE